MKKLLSLMLTLCLLFCTTACIDLDDRADKEDILKLVNDHQDLLLQCIESGDYTALNRFGGIIREIDVTDNCVDFYCGGSGFGSATSYCGFFYSAEGNLSAVWCAPAASELIPDQNGYRWRQQYANGEYGDNQYYVEMICDGFFYYWAAF